MNFIRPIEKEPGTPLYEQVERRLREAICGAAFAPDTAIPTERELAEGFGVSRITIRKALAQLEEDGLLLRRQGSGTFVAPDRNRIQKSLSRITSFSEDMRARGLEPGSEWIGKTPGTVTPEEALALGLSPGAAIYRFSRVRYANAMPMAVECSTVPAFCLPGIEAVGCSLYEAMERHGQRPTKALQRLRAVALDDERAKQLAVPPGTPALLIERRGYARSGAAIEITTSWYRGDAYDFLSELGE